jgi:DNA-directed RNA polymerase specialized sigma24 family protein
MLFHLQRAVAVMSRLSDTHINLPLPPMHLGEDHASGLTSRSTNAQSSASAAEEEHVYRTQFAPLCAFARQRGCESHDAEDAVQELFAKLLRSGQLSRAASLPQQEQMPFLLARLRTHLIKRWHFRTRQRRGGGCTCLPLHDAEGEAIDVPDLAHVPDHELDRTWAREVLERAMQRMSCELHADGREGLWQQLQQDLEPERDASLPARSGALRVALHRARRRLRDFVREQLGVSGEDAGRILGAALV